LGGPPPFMLPGGGQGGGSGKKKLPVNLAPASGSVGEGVGKEEGIGCDRDPLSGTGFWSTPKPPVGFPQTACVWKKGMGACSLPGKSAGGTRVGTEGIGRAIKISH